MALKVRGFLLLVLAVACVVVTVLASNAAADRVTWHVGGVSVAPAELDDLAGVLPYGAGFCLLMVLINAVYSRNHAGRT